MFLQHTEGTHNLLCIAWCASATLALTILALRVLHAILVMRSLSRTGIAYIPKGSLGIRQLPWIESKHKEEAILTLQCSPVSYPIHMKFLTAHVDQVRITSRVDVDVSGAGACTVIFGVKLEAFKSVSSVKNVGVIRSQSLFASDPRPFSSAERLSFEIPTSLSLEAVELSRIPVLIFLQSISDVELTIVSNVSTNMVTQFRISSENEATSVVPIFSQNVDECMVCYDLRSNVVILDCRHCCICTECMQRLRDSRCIVCRHRFNKFLYLPRSEPSDV
jgi:hypothetical protein